MYAFKRGGAAQGITVLVPDKGLFNFFKPEKGQYLHPQWDPLNSANRVNRVITHYEASLLQDFPPDFLWCGSKTEIAKQIGNAVPAGLARAVALHLRSHLG